MNPFKKIEELNRTISKLSRKAGKKAVLEIEEAKCEIERLHRIITSNPCLNIVR